MNANLASMRAFHDAFKADFYGPNGPVRQGSPDAVADYDQGVEAIAEIGTNLDALEKLVEKHEQH